jgi:VanZ family protein
LIQQYITRLQGKLGFWLLTLVWALTITNFSTDRFSIKRTSNYFEPMLRWFLPHASDLTIYVLHVIIRKAGHLTEYGIFAALVFGIWAADEPHWQKRWLGYALSVAALLSLLDEYHQSFSRMRVGNPSDSLIDTVGAAIALFIIWWVKRDRFLPSTVGCRGGE